MLIENRGGDKRVVGEEEHTGLIKRWWEIKYWGDEMDDEAWKWQRDKNMIYMHTRDVYQESTCYSLFTYVHVIHVCVCVFFFFFFSNCLHTFSFGIDYCCIPSWAWHYTIVMTAFFIHIPDWENLWCWTDSWSWSHCATSRGQNQTAWPQQRYNTGSEAH